MSTPTAAEVEALRQKWQMAVCCEQETNDAWHDAANALDVARVAYRQALSEPSG
jgi:hypothetical protein